MALSDTVIRNAKGKDAPYKLFDDGGLFMIVSPAGGKLWRLKYRFAGKEQQLTVGKYPAVGLKDARGKREEAKDLLAKGVDPTVHKKKREVAERIQAGNTFKAVMDEYIQKIIDDGMADATKVKTLWLAKQLEPALGNFPIAEIEAYQILDVLRKVERKGNLETAHRMRSFASRVFKYAIWTTRAKADPAALLAGALRTPKVTHHAAILEPKRVGELLRSLDAFEGHLTTKYALQLSPHVFVRPAELRKAEWPEFNFDERYWRIPAHKMKMGIEHWVPLSRQTIELLLELREITGDHHYLFPSVRTWLRPMSENTINVVLRRLGYTKDEMTGHGFRSTASTLLNESGAWRPDVIEAALAHQDKNKVRRTYNRGLYWNERVEMAQWWSDYLDGLRDNAACGIANAA
ncbi:MAG TPA: integrase arm-type DNA-binding domain-containing protein [Asticcacaulis sp.]|nr:integrase arm-type DNA-binding domain-containing protein [Asticcacaulis sp.]